MTGSEAPEREPFGNAAVLAADQLTCGRKRDERVNFGTDVGCGRGHQWPCSLELRRHLRNRELIAFPYRQHGVTERTVKSITGSGGVDAATSNADE